MALLTHGAFGFGGGCVGHPSQVDAVQKNPLGLRRFGFASDGTTVYYNEYIYLKGEASVAVGSWVNYDEAFVTILLDTDTVEGGLIAVACAAVDATTEFGWFQIAGVAEGLCLASFDADSTVFATSTAGSVDDADTGVGLILGALGRTARDATLGTALFQLAYPHNIGAEADLPN